VKAFARRVAQLEKRAFVLAADPVRNPRKHLRIVVQRVGRQSGQRETTCTRSLCADGTLLEVVRLGEDTRRADDGALDRILAGFPVTVLGGHAK
jgi:hypothetical protein